MATEREKIEAELQLSERARLLSEFKRLLEDVEEFEQDLQAREAELGLPTDLSKPLVERMARVGMSKAAIEQMNMLFGVVKAESVEDSPKAAKQMLAKIADAEYSAVDHLADLIESRRKA